MIDPIIYHPDLAWPLRMPQRPKRKGLRHN